jgi:hypothetical protein
VSESEKFEGWAIVELFGHQRIAGYVGEQQIAGSGFVRVDVPDVTLEGGQVKPAYTRYFGPSSIYGISPCDEGIARRAAYSIERYRSPIPVVVPRDVPGLPTLAAVVSEEPAHQWESDEDEDGEDRPF